jgi:AcrR family transcriptional regulator
MGSSERRAREKEEMRALITRAAMKLFLAEGFEKTSIRRIAEAIEYTPGAIYSYFADKDEILYALHDEGMALLHGALSPVEAIEDPREALLTCCRRYLQFALDNPEYYDLMFIMNATGHRILEKEDWSAGLKNYDVLRRCVYRGIAAGTLPPAHPETTAFGLWSFVHGMLALHIRQRCPMIPAETLSEMMHGATAWLMGTVERAAAASGAGAPPALPAFVPMAGLTHEGIRHLRAFREHPLPLGPAPTTAEARRDASTKRKAQPGAKPQKTPTRGTRPRRGG